MFTFFQTTHHNPIMIALLLSIVCVEKSYAQQITAPSPPIEIRLIDELLAPSRYSPIVLPVLRRGDKVPVEFCNLQLETIKELNEKLQMLTSIGWFNWKWRDSFLVWNTSDYGGIEHIFVPQDRVWKLILF
jgi:hypothetical protein